MQFLKSRGYRFIFLWIVLSNNLNAFSQVKIDGTITNATGQRIANANVLLLRANDSSLIKGGFTNKQGQYSFTNVRTGTYLISSTYTGHEPAFTGTIDVNREETINIPVIILKEESKQLTNVTVQSKKPLFEQKIDRMVVNVQGSITSAGSTALDVLEKSPGIIVDHQNGNIIMGGKDGVNIMINGKLNKMPASAIVQMLSGINASNIEKIELITTPPSNFDAEGNAGFINIVFKTNPDFGTNGSYTLSLGYSNREMSSGNINFNHRKNKINLYGDYSFSRNHIIQRLHYYRQVEYQGNTTENEIITRRNTVRRIHNLRLGLDYQLNKKTVIGALIGSYDNRWTMDALNNSWYVVNKSPDSMVVISNDEVNHWRHYMANVSLQHTINSKEKFSMDADYLYYGNRNPVEYMNSYYNNTGTFVYSDNTRSEKVTPIKIGVIKADYTRQISKKFDLETGAKFTLSQFNNDVLFERNMQSAWITDENFSGKYLLKEKIAAAYTSFNLALTPKTNVKLGVRYEYTISNLGSEKQADLVDRKYGKLFPGIFLSQKLTANSSMNFSYNRRITRPTFNEMAPFLIFLDPKTFISGNAGLQPCIADAVKWDVLIKKMIISATYTFEDEVIARFQPTVDAATNTQTLTAKNQDNKKTFLISFAAPLRISDRWNTQLNTSGTWQEINLDYAGSDIRIEQKYIQINLSNTITFPSDYSMEVVGFFQSGGMFGYSVIKPYGALNIGLQKKLKDNKGAWRLNANDVFNTMKTVGSTNLPEHNLVIRNWLRFVPRTCRITYTRNFGNRQLKSRGNRATGSDEERRRVE